MAPTQSKPPLLTESERRGLYAVKRFLNHSIEKTVRLKLHIDAYMQDPLVAKQHPSIGIDEELLVDWEPGLADGPTSARFAVVDYNSDTGLLSPPAKWNPDKQCFVDENGILDKDNCDSMQFHQANVWAILQRALEFYEDGNSLGRAIPWGFEGNRLIVVPHAGYGQNAYYDRNSKSLQFYYFDGEDGPVYTCLSADIINHEFGHAVLDGIRPLYHETISVETAAFHEFMGDFTAILVLLRNNNFRGKLKRSTKNDDSEAKLLVGIAEQFGHEVSDKPYLRTANNLLKMKKVRDDPRPHYFSQVLTGAMFDIIRELGKHYVEKRGHKAGNALWYTIQRIQRMAIQPLDFLPPVDVTFKDYALAVLRAEQVANPTDPHGYRKMMIDIFRKRGIIDAANKKDLMKTGYVFDRLRLKVFHGVEELGSSREAAYRFLNDNRTKLFIPHHQDIIVTDVYRCEKLTREHQRLPRQTVVLYMWREDVLLDGPQFGSYQGKSTAMLCGGTLVFDDNGNLLHWPRKPGTEIKEGKEWEKEVALGQQRRDEFLQAIARRVKEGQVGRLIDSGSGLIGSKIPPFVAHESGDGVRFELSPHFSIKDDDLDSIGGRKWEISS